MRITDGKRTVDIRMVVWEGNGYSPDWSQDFLGAGGLRYDDEREAYIVEDVDYCIEQAMDWRDSKGDFRDDVPDENNRVFVKEV